MSNARRLPNYESPAFNLIILLVAFVLTALIVTGTVGTVALLRARSAHPSAANPTLMVQPASGGPGTTVLVTGTSFPDGAPVTIYLEPASSQGSFVPRVYGQSVVGEGGDLSLAFAMPAVWDDGTPIAEGQVTIRAVSGNGTAEPVAFFSYQPPPVQTLASSVRVSPLLGSPGDTLTIIGEQFAPGSSVHVYLIPREDAATLDVNLAYTYGGATADDLGEVRIPFAIPAQWPDGSAIEEGEVMVVVATEDFSQRATTSFAFEAAPPPQTDAPAQQVDAGGSSTVPIILLSPTNGEPGSHITVQGRNFPANSSVMLRLAPPESGIPYGTPVYTTAATDSGGQFTAAFALPARWPDGKRLNDGPLSIYAMTTDNSAGWYGWANIAFHNTVDAAGRY